MTQPIEVAWKNSRLRFATGSYDGDGSTDGSNEIDIGFQPEYVFIKQDGAARIFHSVSTTDAIQVQGGSFTNDITDESTVHISANGFTVGDGDNTANGLNVTHHYRAWGIA